MTNTTETAEAGEPEESPQQRPSLVRTLVESLWFPVFFACGFLFCYLLAFHSPSPHHVRVAVEHTSASRVEAALAKAKPGAVDVVPVASKEQAKQSVLDRDTVAGYATSDGQPTLLLAKADGYMLESVLRQLFEPLSAKQGGQPQTVDVAPTASGDAMGTGLFYLVLAWTIPSYIVVMMLLRAASLHRRAKLLVLACWSALLAVGGYYGALSMDVIPNEPLAIPIAMLLTFGISMTCFGLVPLTGQLFPGIAVGLFIFLSMPSSGGAIPVQMVPEFFRALHPFMPMGNLIEALRGLFYFDGVGMTRPILVLAAWLVAGLLLIAGYTVYQRLRYGPGRLEPAGPPVEDPSFEMPRPSAVSAESRRFGQPPMLDGLVRTGGEALPGAVVTVTGMHGKQLVRTETDEHGRFALTGLSEQLVNIVVSAQGHSPIARRVLIRDGEQAREDFELAARQ